MKNIRAVVKATNSRPKRRPMVGLVVERRFGSSALLPRPSAGSLGPAGPPWSRTFSVGQLERASESVDVHCNGKCNFATLIDSCFRVALCAGILLRPAQILLPHLTCKCPLA